MMTLLETLRQLFEFLMSLFKRTKKPEPHNTYNAPVVNIDKMDVKIDIHVTDERLAEKLLAFTAVTPHEPQPESLTSRL